LLSFFLPPCAGNFVLMIANRVRLEEVLKAMETGEYFSIRFVTCDVNRQVGGKILKWENCRLSKLLHERRGSQLPAVAADKVPGLKPSHYENNTRNLVLGRSTQVRKIHIWLILAFNGQKVVL
jgi:hypothetical protein